MVVVKSILSEEIKKISNEYFLPYIINQKLSKEGFVLVNNENIFAKDVAVNVDFIYEDPVAKFSIDLPKYANEQGYNIREFYGKEMKFYVYDTANTAEKTSSKKYIYLSVICDNKLIIHHIIRDDAHKQSLIKFLEDIRIDGNIKR